MKKILALLLSACLVLSLAACGGNTAPAATETTVVTTEATETTAEPTQS